MTNSEFVLRTIWDINDELISEAEQSQEAVNTVIVPITSTTPVVTKRKRVWSPHFAGFAAAGVLLVVGTAVLLSVFAPEPPDAVVTTPLATSPTAPTTLATTTTSDTTPTATTTPTSDTMPTLNTTPPATTDTTTPTSATTTSPPVDNFEPNMDVRWETEGQGVYFNSLHGFVNMFERGRRNIVSDDGLYKIDESIVNYENIVLPLPLKGFTLCGAGMRRVHSNIDSNGEPTYGSELSFNFFKDDESMNFVLAEVQGGFRDLNERVEWYEQLIEQGYTGIPTVRMVDQVLIKRNDFGEKSAEFLHNGKVYTLLVFTFFDSNGNWDMNRQPTDKELLDLVKQISFVNWNNRATALEAERAAAVA